MWFVCVVVVLQNVIRLCCCCCSAKRDLVMLLSLLLFCKCDLFMLLLLLLLFCKCDSFVLLLLLCKCDLFMLLSSWSSFSSSSSSNGLIVPLNDIPQSSNARNPPERKRDLKMNLVGWWGFHGKPFAEHLQTHVLSAWVTHLWGAHLEIWMN